MWRASRFATLRSIVSGASEQGVLGRCLRASSSPGREVASPCGPPAFPRSAPSEREPRKGQRPTAARGLQRGKRGPEGQEAQGPPPNARVVNSCESRNWSRMFRILEFEVGSAVRFAMSELILSNPSSHFQTSEFCRALVSLAAVSGHCTLWLDYAQLCLGLSARVLFVVRDCVR